MKTLTKDNTIYAKTVGRVTARGDVTKREIAIRGT